MLNIEMYLSLTEQADYFPLYAFKAGGWYDGAQFKTDFKDESDIRAFVNNLIDMREVTFAISSELIGKRHRLEKRAKTNPKDESCKLDWDTEKSCSSDAFLLVQYRANRTDNKTKLQFSYFQVVVIPNSNIFTIFAEKVYLR